MNQDASSIKTTLPFGVEIEVNSFDLKNRPDAHNSLPEGSYEIALLINASLEERVFVSKWCNNHNNNYWVVKPDSSCGLEVCSPVLKGMFGVNRIAKAVDTLKSDTRIKSDSRCSFHVHFDVSSLSETELLSIICWWIKLEGFFMDGMPSKRKSNQYCRLISQSNIVKSVSDYYDLDYFVNRIGSSKYYTLNTFHYYNKRRKTIEFRIMDNLCCLDPESARGWILLLHLFIESSILKGPPQKYNPDDSFSGYCWLNPFEGFSFLGFETNSHSLDNKFVRDWFLYRLLKYGNDYLKYGVFSSSCRKKSYKEICKLEKLFQLK
jgi:hypothetical protein